MSAEGSNESANSGECQNMRQYTGAEELASNLPYIAMTVLGSVVVFAGLSGAVWQWAAGVAYFLYGVLGAFWIMYFVCPHCRYWGTRSCPCGYGRVAEKIRARKPGDRFAEKFRKHIPVIVPLWFVPVLVGIVVLLRSFSWAFLVLLVAFSLVAFVILPLFSKGHACKDCPQKDTCPWMRRTAAAA
jgi:fatty acid desaturase